jgi:hypothetical protein
MSRPEDELDMASADVIALVALVLLCAMAALVVGAISAFVFSWLSVG